MKILTFIITFSLHLNLGMGIDLWRYARGQCRLGECHLDAGRQQVERAETDLQVYQGQ